MKNILILIILVALIGGGYYYSVRKPQNLQTVTNDINNTKKGIIDTTNNSIDSAVASFFKGIGAYSPVYYVQNRNYGVSASQNICNDTTNAGSVGSIISSIQKYTKSVSCIVATDYPSRSFTITAPSKVSTGQYFCADQSGFVGLIPSISMFSTFKEGVKCK